MNPFRTTFEIPPSDKKINHQSKLLLLGSCFTENIGSKLNYFKLCADVNPFGVLYNPVSIANGINILRSKKVFTERDLEFNNDLWYSFYHHSKYSDADKNAALQKINSRIKKSSEFLEATNFLILTFGTAWIFKLKKTKQTVSNCHKLPAKLFQRELLKTENIIEIYNDLIDQLLRKNPKLKVMLTVSPVRHLKDGAEENQISKSTLFLAVKELVNNFENVSYFPSYEIMMDDLRDYRFYAEDMVHPNQIAIDYIWEKFAEVYFEKETLGLMNEVEKIIRAKNHKAYNPKTVSHQQFLKKQLDKIGLLVSKYPYLDLKSELDYFSSELIST